MKSDTTTIPLKKPTRLALRKRVVLAECDSYDHYIRTRVLSDDE